MPVIYEPPYDSPIEDRFARHYEKYANTSVNMVAQQKVHTICGKFILDFCIYDESGYCIGIECDGKDFHERSRDEWRDAMILGGGHLDAIYRLKGSDITFCIEDILFLLAVLEPKIFAERSLNNLEIIASKEVQSFVEDFRADDHERYFFSYVNEGDKGLFDLTVRRQIIPFGKTRFWYSAYEYAKSIGGGKLDDVISSYRNSFNR